MRGTSEGTVKAQSNAIYRKAGVTGRTQLLSLFLEDLMGDASRPPAPPPPRAAVEEPCSVDPVLDRTATVRRGDRARAHCPTGGKGVGRAHWGGPHRAARSGKHVTLWKICRSGTWWS